jgi:hypothetical protein
MKEKIITASLLCALGVATLWMLSSIFHAGDPDAELLRTTREAIRIAREADSDRRRSENLAAVVRIVGLLAVVWAPLVLAYLVYRSGSREEITLAEALEVLEKENLLPEDFEHPSLPCGSQKNLPEPKDRSLPP